MFVFEESLEDIGIRDGDDQLASHYIIGASCPNGGFWEQSATIGPTRRLSVRGERHHLLFHKIGFHV